MPTLTIPDVPETTLEGLRTVAARRGRSLEEEVRNLLTAAAPDPPPGGGPHDGLPEGWEPRWPRPENWPPPPPGVTPEAWEAGVVETPLGLRRVVDQRRNASDLGPEETPDGLPPRRYPKQMSDERKRTLEGIERRRQKLPPIDVPMETIIQWCHEGWE